MNLVKLKIADLQPTDLPREKTMQYYSSLDFVTMQLKHFPQVWDLGDGKFYISDGNNSAVYQARMGKDEVFVDLHSSDKCPFFSYFFDELIENTQLLAEYGVNNVSDLLPLIRWTECGFHRQE